MAISAYKQEILLCWFEDTQSLCHPNVADYL